MAVCFRNMLSLIELPLIFGFSDERSRVDAALGMLEQNKKSEEPFSVSSFPHEWCFFSKEEIKFERLRLVY